MTEPRILEPTILDAIERYFELLQGHASAQEMTQRVLTDDFETGFVGGYMWRGPDGLAAFLADRSVFFDESHEILQLMDITRPAPETISARTRLRFFAPAARAAGRRQRGVHRPGFPHLATAPPTGRQRLAGGRTDGGRIRHAQRQCRRAVRCPHRGATHVTSEQTPVSRHAQPEPDIRTGQVTLSRAHRKQGERGRPSAFGSSG
jgi:hypothetical protein